jgi:hypothetical protein
VGRPGMQFARQPSAVCRIAERSIFRPSSTSTYNYLNGLRETAKYLQIRARRSNHGLGSWATGKLLSLSGARAQGNVKLLDCVNRQVSVGGEAVAFLKSLDRVDQRPHIYF